MTDDDPRVAARHRVLDDVSLILIERALDRRWGPSAVMSPRVRAMLAPHVTGWAQGDEDCGDLMAQTHGLAEDLVDRHWAKLEPALAEGMQVAVAPAASMPGTWADESVRFRPSEPRGDASRAYDIRVRHRVGHGVAGALVTGTPVSVGLGGFAVEAHGPEVAILTLIAGPIIDVRLADSAQTMTRDCWDQWMAVAPLVDRAIESGFLDREAERLHSLGRIVIDPSEATTVLGVRIRSALGESHETEVHA